MSNVLHNPWQALRTITASDFPTTDNSYDPVATPATQRFTTFMLTSAEVAQAYIDMYNNAWGQALLFRFRFSTAGASAIFYFFGTRPDDTSVQLLGSVTVTAGTQKDSSGKYFGASGSGLAYYGLTSISEPATPESGTGIYQLLARLAGATKVWVSTKSLSTGTVTVDYCPVVLDV